MQALIILCTSMKAKESSVALSQSKDILQNTAYSILFTISIAHLLNDTMQSVIPAIYPIIKEKFNFTFTQIGLINLMFQLTASILQPVVGFYTDKNPKPFSLPMGMVFTLVGLVILAFAQDFHIILLAVAIIGMGSSVFHPESSRIAQLASGGKKGLAQSIFQVGGYAGGAIGPLLAALIIVPHGQLYINWFTLIAFVGIILLFHVGKWYRRQLVFLQRINPGQLVSGANPRVSKRKVAFAVGILLILIFSKYFYMAGMTSYFTFYLIEKFHVSIQHSQLYLFAFLAAVAGGTVIGGYVGDTIGRKYVIWASILGAAPFALILPHATLVWTIILAVVIGLIISSAFSAILVYATELMPGRVGMIAGLFFGFAFGMGGIGSAVLGSIADHTNIEYVFQLCAFLPLLGMITGFLPDVEKKGERRTNNE